MNNKLWFLVRMSLKKKIKTKWFLIANVLIAVVIAGIINVDGIINLFGGDFNNQTKVYVIDETNVAYELFKSEVEKTNISLNGSNSLNYDIIKSDKKIEELKQLLINDKKEETSIVLTFKNSLENL